MASGYESRWRRCFRFLQKKCPDGNWHWLWDKYCHCRRNEHIVSNKPEETWHGGILDFKTDKEVRQVK